MILHVSFDKTEYQDPPHRFEAGTPNIAGAIGLGAAIDFIEELGREGILEHEEALTGYGVDRLSRIPGVKLLDAGQRRLGILSLDMEGVHPHDVAQVLDQHHIAVRAGDHCAQPLMEWFGLSGTTRASLGVYNGERDIDRLVAAVGATREMFAR
jgi:cysteine desulfurase/selenocysteine lyase